MANLPKGIVPNTAERLTAAVDLGKYLAHWILVAWSLGATCHIVDYGRIKIASAELGVEKAILLALREFQDVVSEGWPIGSADGNRKSPDQVWIDSGYQAQVVYAFCREAKGPFMPAVGRGAAQHHVQWYNRPTKTSTTVKSIGEEFHCNWLRDQKLRLAIVNADYWNSWVHQRLSTPLNQTGAMTLYHASPEEHLSLAKHLTAEQKVTQFVAGKGVVNKWERLRKNNHWFDALYNACAAGHPSGVRLAEETVQQIRERPSLAEYARRAQETGGR
ncbi:MAG: terminase gpA endonuclease subunit [Pirellulales bacterium]